MMTEHELKQLYMQQERLAFQMFGSSHFPPYEEWKKGVGDTLMDKDAWEAWKQKEQQREEWQLVEEAFDMMERTIRNTTVEPGEGKATRIISLLSNVVELRKELKSLIYGHPKSEETNAGTSKDGQNNAEEEKEPEVSQG